MNSTDHTTPVVAVKAVGLVGTHKRVARFIVFAPANEAFAALPPATVDSLIKPENKPMLTSILPCHKVQLKTVNSETLTSPDGPHNIVLLDAAGAQQTSRPTTSSRVTA
ncbi:putative surface protein with fasciclin (FAS1) repeats [Paraburkholderia sp. WC7.3g]|uniref:fasciclin domain-containing protein n=1 Tax=Paraburkholderia sp. WC7.3g TaxID=2991070 RepID=UPI003D192E18